MAFTLLAVAVVFDLRSRQIPDMVSALLLIVALVATGFRLHGVHWLDLLMGSALGLSVGLVLFQTGGFGGADVKLLTALGAIVGFKGELGVLFYTAIFGGAFAVIAGLRHQREYPYAPAIALGLLAFIVRGYFR